MSIDTCVYLGLGLVFPDADEIFINKVKECYPQFFEINADIENDIKAIEKLFVETPELRKKYGALVIKGVPDRRNGPLTKLLVVKRFSVKAVYDKDSTPDEPTFYVDEGSKGAPRSDFYQFGIFLNEFDRRNYSARPVIWREYYKS